MSIVDMVREALKNGRENDPTIDTWSDEEMADDLIAYDDDIFYFVVGADNDPISTRRGEVIEAVKTVRAES